MDSQISEQYVLPLIFDPRSKNLGNCATFPGTQQRPRERFRGWGHGGLLHTVH